MNISALLKSIESLRIFSLKATRNAQSTTGVEKTRYALSPMPYANSPDISINSIHYRAQEVRPAGLFVAIEGQTADGHDYIDQALENGAVAIVVQKNPGQSVKTADIAGTEDKYPVIIQVPDTRMALADLAACFYNNPSEHMHLTGITGTNGKTTVAYLIESILIKAGFNVGVIGTINYRYADKTFPNPMTTPESLDLQRILSQMRQAGVSHIVMEASSHAMDLYRIKGCRFDVAVFTNLSQDHLDFHGDMQSYWSSKKRLFTEYLSHGSQHGNAAAVINCDDSKGKELAGILSVKVIKTGSAPECEIKAETSRYGLVGTNGRVSTPRGSFDFKTPLVGIHNLENILSASGAAAALNIAPDTIKAGIEALTAIPGRLESIENSSGRFVYVDYAHTPDALENAVSALKAIAPARIICVFGCGGDRDKEKRPMMGQIVARLCDLSVVTSDNPRSEDPAAIIDQILPGIGQVNGYRYSAEDLKTGFDKKGYAVELDRRRAIELAIRVSRPDDAVLIAGKGHETYQILGDTTIDFDDREEARKALNKLNQK
ncbi:UDP-N-acetylmuramoyl-dipeptide--2,6-diaminopimelate ligase (EC [Olavius sp. associated proteobacterium Delta 1]|nr:UDP-N-acetylmuramoyl-dipeptide--2,6-diaminopimelate ligase (EC [Olavius sp. associated proteobacterium Delta 1]